MKSLINLSLILFFGNYVEAKPDLAVKLMASLSNQSSYAKFRLAKFRDNRGDYDEAIRILDELIEDSYTPAMIRKAEYHMHGAGVDKSVQMFEDLLKTANKNGSIRSRLMLANHTGLFHLYWVILGTCPLSFMIERMKDFSK